MPDMIAQNQEQSMDASKHKVTVIIEDEEFSRFEAYCNRNGYKKSTLICRLIREHLDREGYASQREMFQSNAEKGHTRKGSKAGTERSDD
jgi:hypothetical protein